MNRRTLMLCCVLLMGVAWICRGCDAWAAPWADPWNNGGHFTRMLLADDDGFSQGLSVLLFQQGSEYTFRDSAAKWIAIEEYDGGTLKRRMVTLRPYVITVIEQKRPGPKDPNVEETP